MFLQQTLIAFATENWTFHIAYVFQGLFLYYIDIDRYYMD